jgi:hypothetical protein
MAESTLSISRTELRVRIAEFLGYGRTAANWSTDQSSVIDEVLDSGLRRFYFPPAIEGYAFNGHEWTFLKPVDTITLWPSISVDSTVTVTGVHAAGTTTVTASEAKFYASMIGKSIGITDIGTFTITGYTSSTVISVSGDATCAGKTFSLAADGTYRLSDDFGGASEDSFTFGTDEAYRTLKRASDAIIRSFYQGGVTSGIPEYGAVRPVANFTGATGQRFELYVWPTPSQVFTLSFKKLILPDALTSSFPYTYGGMAHSETLIASCLASAEIKLNDEKGVRFVEFIDNLKASIAVDRRNISPWLGYNSDRSVDPPIRRSRVINVTYDGNLYEG